MATEFENFINLELPRRPALLTVAITGFDGDPNVGAPAIITGAPVGTYYQQETPATLWRKDPDLTWGEQNGVSVHALAGALHSADTLSNLNTKISDATLIDTADARLSDARTPITHSLGGAEHSADTLANLNLKISDATLIDTGDSRLSDARTPTAHLMGGAEHTADTLSSLNAKVSDATLVDSGAVVLRDGSQTLTANWDTGAFNILTKAIEARAGQNLVFNRTGGNPVLTILNGTTRFETQPTVHFVGATFNDDIGVKLGSSGDFSFVYSTVQTNNGLLLGTQGAEGNYFLFTDKARFATNFGLGAFSNPTWAIHDGSITVSNLTTFTQNAGTLLVNNIASGGKIRFQSETVTLFIVNQSNNIAITQIAGAEPTNAATQLDSRKLGFEMRAWDGAAPQTRTGWLRFQADTLTNDAGRFTFSSDDLGGSEGDFLHIWHDASGANIQPDPGSDLNLRAAAGRNLELRDRNGILVVQVTTKGALRGIPWDLVINLKAVDNTGIFQLGTGADLQLKYSTLQTNNGAIWGFQGTEGNYLLITDKARIDTNRGLAAFSNPTLAIDDGGITPGNATTFSQNGATFTMDNIVTAGVIVIRGGTAGVKLQHDATTKFEINSTGVGWFATSPVTKAAALTAIDAAVIDGTYDATEQGVLNNVRTRLNEFESRMQTYGLLN